MFVNLLIGPCSLSSPLDNNSRSNREKDKDTGVRSLVQFGILSVFWGVGGGNCTYFVIEYILLFRSLMHDFILCICILFALNSLFRYFISLPGQISFQLSSLTHTHIYLVTRQHISLLFNLIHLHYLHGIECSIVLQTVINVGLKDSLYSADKYNEINVILNFSLR